jgi:hypothetical protein
MPNQPTSFRYPFSLPDDVHPGVRDALRLTFNGVKDLNDAVRKLNAKVGAVAPAAAAAAVATATSSGGGGGPAPPALFLSVALTLTTAQCLALKAVPVQILPANGIGSFFAPTQIIYQYKFATTPYTVNAATDQYLCVYTGTQPTVANVRNGFANILANGFMDQGASQIYVAPGIARGAQSVYENQPLMVGLPSDCSAELLAGDGTLTITAEYALVTLA